MAEVVRSQFVPMGETGTDLLGNAVLGDSYTCSYISLHGATFCLIMRSLPLTKSKMSLHAEEPCKPRLR